MASSPKRFAMLLTTAVRTIKAREDKNLEVIQNELSYTLGRDSGSFIAYLRKGNLPASVHDVEKLAAALLQRRALDIKECEQLLSSAGHPNPQGWSSQAQERAMDQLAQLDGWPVPIRSAVKPFVYGQPLTNGQHFFGRTVEINRVLHWWQGSTLDNVAIMGLQRSGKSSLLHYIRQLISGGQAVGPAHPLSPSLSPPGFPGWVWVDFQDIRLHKLTNLLRHLLAGIGLPTSVDCTLDDFVNAISRVQFKMPVLVIMDELDVASHIPELTSAFWHSLRYLSTTAKSLTFLVAVATGDEVWLNHNRGLALFFSTMNTLDLGPLTPEEAHSLVASSPLPFSPEDVHWILQQSAYWPALLQILCQERWLALTTGDQSQRWRCAGLRRIAPLRYLASARVQHSIPD